MLASGRAKNGAERRQLLGPIMGTILAIPAANFVVTLLEHLTVKAHLQEVGVA